MKRQIVAFVIALSFLLCLCSGAYALDSAALRSEAGALTTMSVVDSGTCGKDVTWELDSTGELFIEGKGEIVPVSSWQGNEKIKTLIIWSGVTSIGHDAFRGCANLTSVSLPLSLQSIGDWAFSNCNNLKTLKVPDNVTSIGDYAFNNCSALTSVTIGKKLSTIGTRAFFNCSSLSSIDFGTQVSTIGNSAFLNCVSLKTLSLPKSLRTIDEDAFRSCENLKKLVLPEGLLSIGAHAFMNCNALQSVALPNSLQSLGYIAFPHETTILINSGAAIESVLQSNQESYKYINTISASNIKVSTSNKSREISLNAKSKSGSKLTFTSKDKTIKVSSAGKVTIPKNYVGKTSIVIKTTEEGTNYAPKSKTVSVSVTIPKASVKTFSSPKKGSLYAKWKGISGIAGYQLEVSESKNFLSGKQIKKKLKASETNITVVGVSSKKKYYFRIRALQSYNGTKFGEWSKVKSVKVK